MALDLDLVCLTFQYIYFCWSWGFGKWKLFLEWKSFEQKKIGKNVSKPSKSTLQ